MKYKELSNEDKLNLDLFIILFLVISILIIAFFQWKLEQQYNECVIKYNNITNQKNSLFNNNLQDDYEKEMLEQINKLDYSMFVVNES